MEIGTIKAVHIYVHEQQYVTAEVELNLKGVNYSFGGHKVLLSGINGGESSDVPFLGRFLFRCMEICEVDSWERLKSTKVLVEVSHGKVIAVGNITGDKWFNPQAEFEAMEHERDTNYVFNASR